MDKSNIVKLLQSDNLLELAYKANMKRLEFSSGNIVTFVVDRNVNYTNICSCKCNFCAFYRGQESSEGYVLSYEVIKSKINELVEVGGTQLLLQGGLNKNIKTDYYFDLLKNIKKDFPDLTIHAFSPAEILFIANQSGLSIKETIQELKKAGLSSIPGGGAEILSNDIRKKISPNKISSEKWLEVMEAAHNAGLKSTATMVIGFGESLEHIAEHLLKIKELQDKTGGFTAFIPWTFVPQNTKMEADVSKKVTAVDYLKTLAVSRLVLDNVINIQASWVTQGVEIAQVALRFGANDFGGTMLEENVVKSAGLENSTNIQEILKYIKNAGYKPAQRDTAYNIIKIFDN